MKYKTGGIVLNTLINDLIEVRGERKEVFAVEMGVTVKTVYNWLGGGMVKKVVAEKILDMAINAGLNPNEYKPTEQFVSKVKRSKLKKQYGVGWDLSKLK